MNGVEVAAFDLKAFQKSLIPHIKDHQSLLIEVERALAGNAERTMSALTTARWAELFQFSEVPTDAEAAQRSVEVLSAATKTSNNRTYAPASDKIHSLIEKLRKSMDLESGKFWTDYFQVSQHAESKLMGFVLHGLVEDYGFRGIISRKKFTIAAEKSGLSGSTVVALESKLRDKGIVVVQELEPKLSGMVRASGVSNIVELVFPEAAAEESPLQYSAFKAETGSQQKVTLEALNLALNYFERYGGRDQKKKDAALELRNAKPSDPELQEAVLGYVLTRIHEAEGSPTALLKNELSKSGLVEEEVERLLDSSRQLRAEQPSPPQPEPQPRPKTDNSAEERDLQVWTPVAMAVDNGHLSAAIQMAKEREVSGQSPITEVGKRVRSIIVEQTQRFQRDRSKISQLIVETQFAQALELLQQTEEYCNDSWELPKLREELRVRQNDPQIVWDVLGLDQYALSPQDVAVKKPARWLYILGFGSLIMAVFMLFSGDSNFFSALFSALIAAVPLWFFLEQREKMITEGRKALSVLFLMVAIITGFLGVLWVPFAVISVLALHRCFTRQPLKRIHQTVEKSQNFFMMLATAVANAGLLSPNSEVGWFEIENRSYNGNQWTVAVNRRAPGQEPARSYSQGIFMNFRVGDWLIIDEDNQLLISLSAEEKQLLLQGQNQRQLRA